MDWLWLIIILFSALASLWEKMDKQQQGDQRPVPDRPEETAWGDWTSMDTTPGETREAFPPRNPKPIPVPVGDFTPTQLPDRPKQHDDLLTAEERDHLFRPQEDLEDEDRDIIAFTREDLSTLDLAEGRRAEERSPFLTAFTLAQVLARPDFRTVPWRRRL
ncbi:MAG TPA: hypothetical protein GXZ98_05855 [Firmicutes bacterium]|jgi:hypothetical protein|nr:hypothetical protein [Bacillota bacterium]